MIADWLDTHLAVVEAMLEAAWLGAWYAFAEWAGRIIAGRCHA